jgi:hypothetical protein
MVLVADLMKSLRDHLTRSSGTGADAWSIMEMGPIPTPARSSQRGQHNAAAALAACKNREKHEATSRVPSESTATTISGSLSRRPAGSHLHRCSQLAVSGSTCMFQGCSSLQARSRGSNNSTG